MPNTNLNSRKDKSLLIIWIFGVLGLLDSLYLSYVKIARTPIYCTPGLGDCAAVNSSRWSEVLGIPVAVLGVVAFGALILTLILLNRNKWIGKYYNLILFGISFSGFLFSLYLTFIELFVLKTVCQWCLLSALSITVILVAVIIRLKFKTSVLVDQGGK
jgi:uncharacterized membrane protein